MPNRTLAGLVAYPGETDAIADDQFRDVLEQLGLGTLGPRLHDYAAWRQTLSPGEQQRIAIARVVLARPDFVFLDEATSALDAASEERAYTLIRERLPHAAIVSVAHRPALARYHETELVRWCLGVTAAWHP